MKKIIKKFLGEVSLVLGVGIFIYNLFNFSYRTFGRGGLLLDLGPELEGIAYYYQESTLVGMSIGAMLFVIGYLIIRNKKYNLNYEKIE